MLVDRLVVSMILGGLPKRRRRPILYGCGWWLVGGLMDGLSIRLRPVIVDRMDGRYPVVARHMLVALRRRRPVLTRWWLAAVIMVVLPKRRRRPMLYGWWLVGGLMDGLSIRLRPVLHGWLLLRCHPVVV